MNCKVLIFVGDIDKYGMTSNWINATRKIVLHV